jgi:hypothetical protein
MNIHEEVRRERFVPAGSWGEVRQAMEKKLYAGEAKVFTKEHLAVRTETVAAFFPQEIQEWSSRVVTEIQADPELAPLVFVPENFQLHTTLQWSELDSISDHSALAEPLRHVAHMLARTPLTLSGPFAGDGSVSCIVNIPEDQIKEMRQILSVHWSEVFTKPARIDPEKVHGMWMTLMRYKAVPQGEQVKALLNMPVITSPEFVFSKLVLSDNDVSYATKINIFDEVSIQKEYLSTHCYETEHSIFDPDKNKTLFRQEPQAHG